jgi:ZIP family zinc transporter
MPQFWIAFGLTLFAGLGTGLGGAFAFFAKRTNTKFLALALGFSAGVMIYISMAEIFFQGQAALTAALGARTGAWVNVASFFGGIALIALIDRLVPKANNPHEMHKIEDIAENGTSRPPKTLLRTGLLTALAVTIHNFPEGLATFMSAYSNAALGIPIAVAIAIHNIPEGIAVSVPVYYATGSRKKGLVYSLLSGLSEPVGALLGFWLISAFLDAQGIALGVVFAFVAGIMVFISLDELLPAARAYGDEHLPIYGVVAGMAVMAVSLNLFI